MTGLTAEIECKALHEKAAPAAFPLKPGLNKALAKTSR
jgi:hypothetical protein